MRLLPALSNPLHQRADLYCIVLRGRKNTVDPNTDGALPSSFARSIGNLQTMYQRAGGHAQIQANGARIPHARCARHAAVDDAIAKHAATLHHPATTRAAHATGAMILQPAADWTQSLVLWLYCTLSGPACHQPHICPFGQTERRTP